MEVVLHDPPVLPAQAGMNPSAGWLQRGYLSVPCAGGSDSADDTDVHLYLRSFSRRQGLAWERRFQLSVYRSSRHELLFKFINFWYVLFL